MRSLNLVKLNSSSLRGPPLGFLGASASRGNHYGDSKRITLPNSGVSFRVSSLYWQYWDPRDMRPWIEVQLPAPLSSRDYLAGVDPALHAIALYSPR